MSIVHKNASVQLLEARSSLGDCKTAILKQISHWTSLKCQNWRHQQDVDDY